MFQRIFKSSLDWQSRAVLRRHFLVFIRTWKTALVPPLFEPLVTLTAMGFGVGFFVVDIEYAGAKYSYLEYIVPGILINTVFFNAFFEGLFASYVRMFYQKTFDGMLTTRIELEHVIWGEMLWGGCRASINLMAVFLVLGALQIIGYIDVNFAYFPLILIVSFMTCIIFNAIALIISSQAPTIDHLSYGVFLIAIPLSFISNTFFPFDTYGAVPYWLSQVNPLYHLSEFCRGLMLTSQITSKTWINVGVIMIFLPIPVYLAQIKMRKRVLGE